MQFSLFLGANSLRRSVRPWLAARPAPPAMQRNAICEPPRGVLGGPTAVFADGLVCQAIRCPQIAKNQTIPSEVSVFFWYVFDGIFVANGRLYRENFISQPKNGHTMNFYRVLFPTSHGRFFAKWSGSGARHNTVKTKPRFGECYLGVKPKRGWYVFGLFFMAGLCSAISFKRSRRELSIDVAQHRSILKNYQNTHYPRIRFIPH